MAPNDRMKDSPAIEPLLVGRRDASRICGISPATWDRLESSGKVGPLPVRLGGRVLYRVAELRGWVAAGCPDRTQWITLQDMPGEALRARARRGGG